MDILIFVRADAFGWTNRLERYFGLLQVNEMERMHVVMITLEGNALICFQWWESCNPNPKWESFKMVMVRRFPTHYVAAF